MLAQAQAAQFAAVWLWRIADWTPAGQPLEAHSLTVTQMAFSSTGQHLLTVSRDRTFAVWERQTAGETSTALYLNLCISAMQNTVSQLRYQYWQVPCQFATLGRMRQGVQTSLTRDIRLEIGGLTFP